MQEHGYFTEHFLTDPAFWVAIGTIIFAVLVFKQAKNFILGALDKRGNEIQKELDRARLLREEAEALLSSYHEQYEAAVKSSAEIVLRAQEDAVQTVAKLEEELKASIDKRRQMAEAKIALAETHAMQDVRQHIVDIAVSAAREVITARMGTGQGDEAIRFATTELQRKLH